MKRDHEEDMNQRLLKNEEMLEDQQNRLLNTVNLQGDAQDMMNDGMENLVHQRDKIVTADKKNEDIGTKQVRGNNLADSIKKRESCTKCMQTMLAILLLIANIIVAIYKVVNLAS